MYKIFDTNDIDGEIVFYIILFSPFVFILGLSCAIKDSSKQITKIYKILNKF